eukprot:CAMPEP_0172024894 /NCGR_PEP_ID=MMETSP1041-20130122/15596_1 /TAXON_ID=464988 /ORGANISM="Hemiselmis andersenii, Strain CCMP439" /LENGTH=384 /DNA_ID=CAMNT_0012680531 /DNA_START=34 /DNA_END=1185 /DNA_ORIENTATION=+
MVTASASGGHYVASPISRSSSASSLPLRTGSLALGGGNLPLNGASRRCDRELGFAAGGSLPRPQLSRSASAPGACAVRKARAGGPVAGRSLFRNGQDHTLRRDWGAGRAGVLLLAAIAQFGGRGTPSSTNTNLQASLGATADEVFAPPPPIVPATIPSPSAQLLLGASATTLLAIVGTFSVADGLFPIFSSPDTLANIPAAAALFGVADVVAQKMEKQEKTDVRRMLSASAIGVVINAFGFAWWVHYLDLVLPDEMVGLASPTAAAGLVCKTLLDSFVWGTISNSFGIYARRLLSGDTPKAAGEHWEGLLPGIVGDEFRFWPFFQALTYGVIPSEHRVQFTAIGAFVWNVYMSMSASDGPQPHEEQVVVGGIASEEVAGCGSGR